jgi:BirA family biotin operon repressor/biotin-[acetyl-CoA-carboxylase] ligase
MVKEKILDLLYKNQGEYIAGDELSSQLGLSRTKIWDEIQYLKEDGYVIDSSPQDGYLLVKSPNRLFPFEIRKGLESSYMGQEIHYFKKVDSTNDVAKELAEEGAPEGTIVIAEQQTRGKARHGKTWLSPEGGVWMTMILRPKVPPSKAPLLTLVTGVAAATTIYHEFNINVGIKWPNDILIGDKKACGILTEAKSDSGDLEYVVVGIGIDLNVDVDQFPPDLRFGATSLKNEMDRELRGASLVQKFLKNFEDLYEDFKEGKFPEILAEWRRMSKTIGRKVEVRKTGRVVYGEAVGINKDGVLILELEDGSLRKVLSGECIHLPRSR